MNGVSRAKARVLVLTAVAGIVMAGSSGCSSESPAAPGPVPQAAPPASAKPELSSTMYQSPDGYVIRPPAAWVMHPTNGQDGISVLFTAPAADAAAAKPFVDNINVAIQTVSGTLDQLMAETKQKYPSYLPNYQVVTDQALTTPDGQSAHLLGGTYDSPGTGRLENIQLTVLNAGKAYTTTFTSPASSFDSYHALVQASLASFTLG